jgi:hypothetical protein
MPKFAKTNYREALGFCPIADGSDADVWNDLLTPLVRGLLGDITEYGKPTLMETQKGAFPGDEASNMNDHRLYGGQVGLVRFPYLNTVHRTTNGVLVIKRDRVKLKVIAWFGDPFKGKGEVIYKVALRDRRFDGKLITNDCALLDFPMDDPAGNTPLPYGFGLENTAYAFMPGTRISEISGDEEFEQFIGSPFTFMDDADKFLRLFRRAWNSGRSPGQVGKPIPDVSRHLLPGFDKVARKCGYDFVEGAVSHYHVVMWELNYGYRCTYKKDADTIAAMSAQLKRMKSEGVALSRPQESWVCVLQNLRPVEAIPKELWMGGLLWPQTNLDQRNLWINHPLNDGARRGIPAPLSA